MLWLVFHSLDKKSKIKCLWQPKNKGGFYKSKTCTSNHNIIIKHLNKDWVYIQAVELKLFRATPSILVAPSIHQSLMPLNKRRKCCRTTVHFSGIHFQSSASPVLFYDSFAIQLTCLALNSFFFYHQVAPGYVMGCCLSITPGSKAYIIKVRCGLCLHFLIFMNKCLMGYIIL